MYTKYKSVKSIHLFCNCYQLSVINDHRRDRSKTNFTQRREVAKRLNEQFKACYKDFLADDIELHPTNVLRSLQSLLATIKGTPYKLYLLIDEYDNFANEVMMAGKSDSRDRYEGLIQGEGALKAVFKAVKTRTKGLGIDRIFITGVSSVVIRYISSGFNIAENVYLTPQFNDLAINYDCTVIVSSQSVMNG